jgi:DNA processing protein
MTDNTLALAISLIPLLGPLEQYELAMQCPDEKAFIKLKGMDLYTQGAALKMTRVRAERFKDFNGEALYEEALNIMGGLEKRGITIVSRFDESYPALLKNIYDPPFLLYAWGTFPKTDKPALAVVGTRRPSLQGRQETSFFVRECAPLLGSIVSGMALGIDGAAHKAALAEKAHTTAVLGSGFNYLYPSAHKGLAAKIIEQGGLLLSEFAPDTPPHHYNFPGRNRIVSGLCQGTVVMEAPLKSGTLITADFALEQGRDLFVHAFSLNSDPRNGVIELYEQGASALRRGSDLAALWNLPLPAAGPQKPRPVNSVENEPKTLAPVKGYTIGQKLADNLWKELNEGSGDAE